MKKELTDNNEKDQPFVFVLEDDEDIVYSKSIPKIMNSLKGADPNTPFLGALLN